VSGSPAFSAKVRARAGALTLDVELPPWSGTLALVGPNGAGKSSLLATLLGVAPVESARITIGRSVLCDTSAGVSLPVEARRLGWVPQDYALFPHLSVRGNVEFAARSAGADRRASNQRTEALLDSLGVAHLAARGPESLSGGEKQRVALARALAAEPRALLLDEPLAALDVTSRREVRAFLGERLAGLGLPTLVVTHDAADARALGENLLVLEAGRVTQVGTWPELSASPASPFVEDLVRGGERGD
jgi:molybdate transport system ATP-binding protein